MEKISALMDGELDEHEARTQLARLKQTPELEEGWQTFHLIGDTMRGDRALSQKFPPGWSRRFAAEPTILAPRRSVAKRVTTYALSAAASLSAIALVGWVALSTQAPAPQIAKAPVTTPSGAQAVPAAAALASVPSDGRMNEYLMAHQEFSPSTALQGLAPYIRSVSSTPQPQGR